MKRGKIRRTRLTKAELRGAPVVGRDPSTYRAARRNRALRELKLVWSEQWYR